MIAASVLLILVAVVLLVVGLAGGSSSLLIVSIAASLLSAVAFVVFARQAAANRAAAGREAGLRPRTAATGPSPDEPVSPVPHHTSTVGAGGPGWRQPPGSPVAEPYDATAAAYSPAAEPYSPVAESYSPVAEPSSPAAAPAPTSPAPDGPFEGDPPAEFLSAGQVARLTRLADEVRVVDGHPRFHLDDCPHLVGRLDEVLPVAEAVGLGFTPCAHCAAATTLLADARPR
ncbi:hypothetical protein [Micromonospora robiginosa]|uniref:Clumping factor A n=1 Tax=Micromonospora robiginosa TaxID=2749844 RepID=A0A7L6B5A7_9ACTN|nr:hypothetical protein [Micromonospora ferruginea]QLQ37015.1 hypothetical protein H1D33_27925 [Micromonospora ferruginea]